MADEQIRQPLNKSVKESLAENSGTVLRPERSSVNDPISESLLTIELDDVKNLKRRYKILGGFGCCCLILGIFLFLAFPPILTSVLKSGATDQVVLSKETEDFWAHFPGETETVITRNFSFFNFMNAEEVLLFNATPQFREVEGYIVNELEDYINITYIQDGDKVTMKDWLHFSVHEDSRDLDQKVKVANVGGLGLWYQLKATRDAQIFLQGFSLLFSSIEDSIVDTVLAQGIWSQYLPTLDAACTQFMMPSGIPHQQCSKLWQDYTYGLSNQDNVRFWIAAARDSFADGYLSADAVEIKNYFDLDVTVISSLLSEISVYTSSVQNLIINNHYCDGINNCNGRQLAIRQVASSYVTYDTPPVAMVTPSETICEANTTCKGFYPEISAYFKNVYLKEHEGVDPFLSFDVDLVRKWLDYNPTNLPDRYNTNQSALLHIGNLDALFNNGTLYDGTDDPEEKKIYLNNIKERFELPSDQHTKVFWAWVKYILSDVVRQGSEGNQVVGIGNYFSKGFYRSFMQLQQRLQPFILKHLIRPSLEQKSCSDFLSTSLQTNDKDLIESICNHYEHNIQSDQFIGDMVDACHLQFQSTWKKLIDLNMTMIQIQSLCDPAVEGGFGALYDEGRRKISEKYHCEAYLNTYCTDYRLAVMQWANGTVTSDPLGDLSSGMSFALWDSSVSAFEYGYFASKFKDRPFPTFSLSEAYQMVNFDNWFSASVILSLFNSNSTSLEIQDYIRFVTISSGLKGFTQERTARQLMFGYTDELIDEQKTAYPPFGGDPSIQSYLAFNDLNLTEEQVVLELEWYTGKSNSVLTSQYHKINGYEYLTTNYSHFNGNESYWKLQTPWKVDDYFYGTSGKQFAPDQDNSQNISIYVPNVQRYGSGSQGYPYERFGFDLQIAYLGASFFQTGYENPDNDRYYQEFYGILNETCLYGAPLFLTKHHFMNVSSNWTEIIHVYNEDGSIFYNDTSHWDDSFVIVQPISGVAFQATIYLQANYFYEADLLFTYNQTSLLPVFSVYRSGNVTEQTAQSKLGVIKTVGTVQKVGFGIGITLSVLSLGLVGFSWVKYRRVVKEMREENMESAIDRNNKETKIKISMQKVDAQKLTEQVGEKKIQETLQ